MYVDRDISHKAVHSFLELDGLCGLKAWVFLGGWLSIGAGTILTGSLKYATNTYIEVFLVDVFIIIWALVGATRWARNGRRLTYQIPAVVGIGLASFVSLEPTRVAAWLGIGIASSYALLLTIELWFRNLAARDEEKR